MSTTRRGNNLPKRKGVTYVQTGEVYGDLTVLEADAGRLNITPTRPRGHRAARVQCACGTVKLVVEYKLKVGDVTGCGCKRVGNFDKVNKRRAEKMERGEKIVFCVDWASRYGAQLQLRGTVGVGRPCVGILHGDHYIDTEKARAAFYKGDRDWWEPEDCYHKHACMAVLVYGGEQEDYDRAFEQLYEWVKWCCDHSYGIETVYRQPENEASLLLHGIELPQLVLVV